jgi:hypothetical protein
MEHISSFREFVQAQFISRSRKENDMARDKDKSADLISKYSDEMNNLLNKVALLGESMAYVKEILKIQTALNLQEELDKQTVGLYGL